METQKIKTFENLFGIIVVSINGGRLQLFQLMDDNDEMNCNFLDIERDNDFLKHVLICHIF